MLQSSQIILEVEILVELLLYLFAIVRDVVSMMAKRRVLIRAQQFELVLIVIEVVVEATVARTTPTIQNRVTT